MALVKIIVAVVICLSAGFGGSFFTQSSLTSWYPGITKPSWNPPNWVFAPVWTALFVMMGVAAGWVWALLGTQSSVTVDVDGSDESQPKNDALLGPVGPSYAPIGLIWFGVQLVLNVLWSFSFFYLQSPLIGVINIAMLWVAIVVTIWFFWRVRWECGFLLLPYLGWVSFASVLNWTIWRLNA